MKIKETLFALASLSLIVPISPTESAGDRMRAGLWERTKTENGKDTVTTKCFVPEGGSPNGTEQEIRASLEKDATAAACAIKDFSLKGDTITYTFACADASVTDSTTYHGDTYESMMISKSSSSPTTTRHIKGRRVGDCPGASAAPAPSGAAKGNAPAAPAKANSPVRDAKVTSLEASIDRALAAYNRQDPKAFYDEWLTVSNLPVFTDYYVDAMKTLGNYVSRTMIKGDSVLDTAAPMLVYQAKFSKAPKVKIAVHFTKEGAETRIFAIELDKM